VKIEINLPVFADLPADQQITIYREIQNSIKAIASEFCIKSRCWGAGSDGKIEWTFEKSDE
jgi:hypothetical protein